MPIKSAWEGPVVNPLEPDKVYKCRLYKPYLLSVAINKMHPDESTLYAVNIGAGNGISCNDPVFPLYKMGYSGLAIEGDDNIDLVKNLSSDKIIKLTNTIVTPMNISELLLKGNCPKSCDFLKIDIDGYDGPVLKAILDADYRPKVIQMEINPEFPPPIKFAVLYDPDYKCQDSENNMTGFYGASMAYVINLGKQYGYKFANIDFVTQWTHDITLVHEDYFNLAVGLFGNDINNKSARELYLEHPPGYSHFKEYSIDSLNWRYRTDYDNLLEEIKSDCEEASLKKHNGKLIPFHLSY